MRKSSSCVLFSTLALILWASFHSAHAGTIINRPLAIGLTNGLVGYWSFDSATMGTTSAADLSGNNSSLWLNPGASQRIGKIGQGISGAAETPATAALEPTKITISVWVEQPIGGTVRILTNPNSPYELKINKPKTIPSSSIEMGINSFTCDVFDSGISEPFLAWNHYVFTYDGSRQRGYFNGALVQDANCGLAIDYTGVTTLQVVNSLNMGVDDFRIYNRALSPDEIKRLYNLGGTFKVNKPANSGMLTNGLIGYWPFEASDMIGTTSIDRSGQGNNLVISVNSETPQRVIGKIGQALRFDGVNSDLDLGNGYTAMQPTSGISICEWLNYESGIRNVIALNYNGGSYFGYQLEINTTGVFWRAGSGAAGDAVVSTTIGATPNTWEQWCLTWAGDVTRIYKNGAPLTTSGTTNASGALSYTGVSDFHLMNDGTVNDTKGILDDVRIYNRALSADEVKRLYNLGGTFKVNAPQTTSGTLSKGLVGYWSFEPADMAINGSGVETALDRSGQGNNGTLTNGPQRAIGRIGQALGFDGTDDYVSVGDVSALQLTGSMTISAWAKTDGQDESIVSKYDSASGGATVPYYFAIVSGKLRMFVSGDASCNDGTNDRYRDGNSTINNGQWHHVVGVYDASAPTVLVYVDGTNDGGILSTDGSPASAIPNCTDPVEIGRHHSNAGGSPIAFFTGPIDDVRIYNRVLTPDEVKRLYLMGK